MVMDIETAKLAFANVCRCDLFKEMMNMDKSEALFVSSCLDHISEVAGPEKQQEYINGLWLMIGGTAAGCNGDNGSVHVDSMAKAVMVT
jgi:hypothetical protein